MSLRNVSLLAHILHIDHIYLPTPCLHGKQGVAEIFWFSLIPTLTPYRGLKLFLVQVPFLLLLNVNGI